MSRRKRNQPIYHFNKITILIRNTYRPNTFSKCIQSVLMQEYTNYSIIMCYDDDRCMEYLEEYRNHNKIELFKVKRESEASHFDNLYCNHLLDRVRDGWIIFLDDDNMLSQPDTLKKINNNIKTENDIIFWKVKLGEHIIYPNIYDIKYGQIDAAGFCFHSKYKNAARWIAEQGSDFHYVTHLLQKHYLIRRAHSEILTQSILVNKQYYINDTKLQYTIEKNNPIKYDIILNNIINQNSNKLWAHLHCYDIDLFEEIYGNYIKNIINYFNVIVTFSKGQSTLDYNIILLKINNKGVDIGAKLCMLDYIYNNNINYSHILFLHSKNNLTIRNIYFKPFIYNTKQINYICSIIEQYDLIVPNLILNGDWNINNRYFINNYYYKWYNNLNDFKNLTYKFIEGNCLIASNKLINAVFPTKYLNYFYNILNTKMSYDYNWVRMQYGLQDKDYNKVYNIFKQLNFLPNHLNNNDQILQQNCNPILKNEKLKYFLKDGSIEHLWERVWLNVTLNINGKYKIITNDLILENNKLRYNFDINLYRFLNKSTRADTRISEQNNSIEHIENIKNLVLKNKNLIYSLRQILEKLPIDFDIIKYAANKNLYKKNKYEIINHYIQNNKTNNKLKWIDLQTNFNKIKTFVYIFPQFHEIPENNNFWGKGFTEWWNVRKTYQIHNMHLPIHPHKDIGYYNILDYKTRKRWNTYAKEYGFYGYIYCHFWFSKGIIMNKPLDKILEDGQPDKPWFLNWINENWTKRWDGGDNEILLHIKLDITNVENHFNILLKYFKHTNYYKINNKPCLGIYRAEEIPKFYIDYLNNKAKKNGFNGITFIKTLNNTLSNNFKITKDDYCEYEFEYPPNYKGTVFNSEIKNNLLKYNIDNNQQKFINNYNIEIHYRGLINTKQNKKKLIRGIMPSWDNFPRHHKLKSNSYIQIGSNSFIFYLIIVKQFLLIKREKGEYYFINALNEWAEQCVMEPSIQNEYSYLEAFKLAKQTDLNKINELMLDKIIYY